MTIVMPQIDTFSDLWRVASRVGIVLAYAIKFSILAIFGWWSFIDTSPPLRITGPEYAVTLDVKRGGDLVVVRNYCVDTPAQGVIDRRIVDGVVWQLPLTTTSGSVGCYEDRKVFIDLPEAIPPGLYEYRVSISYKLNPLTTVSVAHESVKFRVIE